MQQDTRSRSDLPYLSLNIVPVYAMGYTGKGVRVCVIDDGLEHTHDDLRDNYVSVQGLLKEWAPGFENYVPAPCIGCV